MKEERIFKTIPLNDTKNGTISFAIIKNPYEEDGNAVVSIGIMIDDTKPEWKVHIPFSQIKEVRKILKKARKKYKPSKKGKQ